MNHTNRRFIFHLLLISSLLFAWHANDALAGVVPKPSKKCKRILRRGPFPTNLIHIAANRCYIKELKKARRKALRRGKRRDAIKIQTKVNKTENKVRDFKKYRRWVNFSGEWSTNLEPTTIAHFKHNDHISGTWTDNGGGSLYGYVLADKVVGTWRSGDSTGIFSIKMSRSNGSWSGYCNGPWSGTRVR